MLIRIPSPAFRRDVALVAAGLVLGAVFSRGCHSSYQGSSDKPIETSSYQADRRVEQAKSRLQTHPEDLDALADMAIGYYLKGPEHFADGVNALEKARALGSTDERLFFYAGLMYEALGLFDYAANDFGRYLRHHPDDYESLVRLGNILFKLKKYDEARALYRQALSEWPKDPTVWFNYAVVLVGKGEAEEAENALARTKKIAGDLPEGGRFVEGEIARLRAQDDNAMTRYEEELSIHPSYVPALEALEVVQKKKGLVKEARNTHKRLVDARKAAAQASMPVETKEGAFHSVPVSGSSSSAVSVDISSTQASSSAVSRRRRRAESSSSVSEGGSNAASSASATSASASSTSVPAIPLAPVSSSSSVGSLESVPPAPVSSASEVPHG